MIIKRLECYKYLDNKPRCQIYYVPQSINPIINPKTYIQSNSRIIFTISCASATA